MISRSLSLLLLLALPAAAQDDTYELTAKRLAKVPFAQTANESRLLFSPDGKTVALLRTYQDYAVRLFDAATGAQKAEVRGLEDKVGWGFSADGERFVLGSKHTVAVLDARSGRTLKAWDVDPKEQYSPRGARLAVSPDGRWAAFPDSGKVRLVDVARAKESRTWSLGKDENASTLAFSRDGKLLFAAVGSRLFAWQTESGKEAASASDPCANAVMLMRVSPDGATLATINNSKMLCLWDLPALSMREYVATDADAYGGALEFSPDSRSLLAFMTNTNMRAPVVVFDTSTGKPKTSFKRYAAAPWAISRDWTMFASRPNDPTQAKLTIIWDLETGLQRLVVTEETDSLAFSADGETLIAGGYTANFIESSTGRRRKWADGSFKALAVSPDGKTIASAGFSEGFQLHAFAPAPPPAADKPTAPARLAAEASAPAALSAGARAAVKVTVTNTGAGAAHAVRLTPRIKPWHPGLLPPAEVLVGKIEPGASVSKDISLHADEQLASGRVKMTIEVPEGNGFDAAPLTVEFDAKGFEPPRLEVSVAGEPLKAGEENTLTFTVRNAGNGRAERVALSLKGEAQGMFVNPEKLPELGALGPGESKQAQVKVFTNARYAGGPLPLSLSLNESSDKYGFKERPLSLAFGEAPALKDESASGLPEFYLRRSGLLQADQDVQNVTVSRDGRLLAAYGGNDKLIVWEVAGSRRMEFRSGADKRHGFTPAGFAADGKCLLAVTENRVMRLDLEKERQSLAWKGSEKSRIERKETGSAFQPYYDARYNVLLSGAMSPDGRTLALAGCYDKGADALILDMETGREQLLPVAANCPASVRYSPDGSKAVYVGQKGVVEVWDTLSRARLASLSKDDKNVYDASFSPDGRLLAVGTADKGLHVWDLQTQKLLASIPWPDYDVYSVAFSLDGRWLAAGSGTVRLYEVGTWAEKARLEGGYGKPFAFLPDGRFALATSKSVLLYSLTKGAAAPKPRAPAKLSASVAFVDPSGSGALEAGEKAELEVKLANAGPGTAYGVRILVSPADPAHGVRLPEPEPVGEVAVGKSLSKKLPLSAALDVASGRARLKVEAREANGFDSPAVMLELETRALKAPKLELAALEVAGAGVVKPNELNRLTVAVRNAGEGAAREVTAELVLGDKDLFPSGEASVALGTLEPGQTKRATFEFFVNARFKGKKLPVSLTATESFRRFGLERLPLQLELGEAPSLEVVKIKAKAAPSAAVDSEDVDEPPTVRTEVDPESYAVVIGVERYRQQGLPSVDFAARDAKAVHAYLTRSMGFDSRNVVLLQNEGAAKTDLEKYLGPWLKNRVSKKSRVLVYYAGHGAPNPATGEGYLLPFDGDPAYTSDTAYPIRRLYDTLAELPTKDVTVVLDACFSGQGSRSVIAKGTRPLVAVSAVKAPDNAVVLAAAAGEQISASLPDEQHGLMTYYLLRGLKGKADADADGKVTTAELYSYLRPEVEREARRQNVEQTPTLSPSADALGERGNAVWLKLK